MSPKVPCDYCRVPFRPVAAKATGNYCCTGCAMIAAIPVDEHGQFPVNGALIKLLAAGFVYFNQALFWALALILSSQGKAVLSARFVWASYIDGLILAVLAIGASVATAPSSLYDRTFFAAVTALYLAAWMVFPPSAGLALAANALLLLWLSRGVWLRRLRKN